jgi:hypothetical protein
MLEEPHLTLHLHLVKEDLALCDILFTLSGYYVVRVRDLPVLKLQHLRMMCVPIRINKGYDVRCNEIF